MMEYLAQIEFWHWWVLAVALVTLEMLAPSTVLLWPGISAAIVGIILLIAPSLDWEFQVLIFAVLSVGALMAAIIGFTSMNTQATAEQMTKRFVLIGATAVPSITPWWTTGRGELCIALQSTATNLIE